MKTLSRWIDLRLWSYPFILSMRSKVRSFSFQIANSCSASEFLACYFHFLLVIYLLSPSLRIFNLHNSFRIGYWHHENISRQDPFDCSSSEFFWDPQKFCWGHQQWFLYPSKLLFQSSKKNRYISYPRFDSKSK